MNKDLKSRKTFSFVVILIIIIISVSYLITFDTENVNIGTSIGNKPPGFTLKSIDGENFSLEDYEDKVVILSFFYVYCGQCIKETSELKQIRSEYNKEEVGIISIDIFGSDENTVKSFKESNGGNWRFATSREVGFEIYQIGEIPYTYVLNTDQKIIYKNAGEKNSKEKLMNIIDNSL